MTQGILWPSSCYDPVKAMVKPAVNSHVLPLVEVGARNYGGAILVDVGVIIGIRDPVDGL